MTATVAVTIAVAMSPTCVRVHRRVRTIRVVPRTSVRVMPCAVVVVVHSGLGYVAVSIEAVALMVVATPVSHEYCRTIIVEAVSVVVGIDAERPSSCLPCHGTIEVGAAHIPIILPGVQDKPQVSITTVPPDAERVVVTIDAQQVVQINLIDCFILCCREVQLIQLTLS